MREIKFRAWDKYNKKMLYNFIIHSSGSFIDEYSECRESFCGCQEYGLQRERSIDKESVMQYIGLTDENGKEIYEGDILSYKTAESYYSRYGEPQIVKYNGSSFQCDYQYGDLKAFISSSIGVEVIGNIYENPELLNKEQN